MKALVFDWNTESSFSSLTFNKQNSNMLQQNMIPGQ